MWGLGRVFLLHELMKEIRGLAQPTVVLHLSEEIHGRKKLLLRLIEVTEWLHATLLS